MWQFVTNGSPVGLYFAQGQPSVLLSPIIHHLDISPNFLNQFCSFRLHSFVFSVPFLSRDSCIMSPWFVRGACCLGHECRMYVYIREHQKLRRLEPILCSVGHSFVCCVLSWDKPLTCARRRCLVDNRRVAVFQKPSRWRHHR